MSVTVHHGDCLDVLRGMAEASVDACCTDPPYHLTSGKKGGTGPASLNLNSPAGRSRVTTGFMGKAWDGGDVAMRPETWAEVYRVMKPGAHLVAFGGTRTYHRLACAIEDAGFEVRDQLGWVYGTGFPKSLDVGKAIDKRPGVTLHKTFVTELTAAREASGLSRADLSERVVGTRSGACWNWEHHQFPEFRHWAALKANLPSLNDRWGAVLAQAEREVVGRNERPKGWFTAQDGHEITAPATPEAARWSGWGTALKPAWEPIVLARKPLACPTVAAQVLATGTGALNIGATRVPMGGEYDPLAMQRQASARVTWKEGEASGLRSDHEQPTYNAEGRFPANLCHDGSPEVLEAFGRFGERPGAVSNGSKTKAGLAGTKTFAIHERPQKPGRADTGSAARFFPALGFGEAELRFHYSAKASKADRAGSRHPTIKPVALMRWLCRLVTPPGGVVLDPFAGSGTTGEAALREGFAAVLIEREAEYVADIERRLARYRDEAPLLAEVAA